MLARLVNESGFKVALTGEGSDELFGGYDIFKEAKIRRFWGSHPDSRWRPLLLKRLYPYLQNLQAQSPAYLKAFFRVRPEDLANPFFSHLPRWDLTAQARLFFSEDLKASLRSEDPIALLEQTLPSGFDGWDPFLQGQYLETTGLLPGYLLSSQGDRMAMAHGVEGRYPFLDPRVVEFSTMIPPRLKMKGLDEKHILKRAAGQLIPESVRKRPKQPYRAPDAKCFLSGGRASEPWVDELLSESRIRADGVFHPAAVTKLVEKARKDQVVGIKDNMALVGILSTQLLVEHFIRNPSRDPQACLTSSKT
jgi:asparagine synthase (glutamine-hydrolysing)